MSKHPILMSADERKSRLVTIKRRLATLESQIAKRVADHADADVHPKLEGEWARLDTERHLILRL